MLTSKQTSLKPLLESENGVHLTAYLANRGNLIELKSQLKTVMNESYEWLSSAMSKEELKRFLEPLDSLLLDSSIFKLMKGNIGIFRTFDSFRVLNIPVEVEQSCQVATSFHVKPLLRWLQADREFLLLGLEEDAAHLYLGSQDSFKLIDSILFPEFFKKNEAFACVNDWIMELTKTTHPKLFVAGEKMNVAGLNQHLKYTNTAKNPISNFFGQHNAFNICTDVRKILKEESKKALEKSLLEFKFAEEGNRAQKNIFQIAKAVVRGKVRKLIVTDELSIFGTIDKKTGGLAIHPLDLNHEDDCILDDLAQMVLNQGGEVVIAKRDEIPKGRPILAILDDDGAALEKTEYHLALKAIQERFG
jgi:hypothetical protein